MSNSIVAQIPKNLLFRYRLNCQQYTGKVNSKFDLDESFQLPHLGSFENQHNFADVRVGWHEKGLLISVSVTTKNKRSGVAIRNCWTAMASSSGLTHVTLTTFTARRSFAIGLWCCQPQGPKTTSHSYRCLKSIAAEQILQRSIAHQSKRLRRSLKPATS